MSEISDELLKRALSFYEGSPDGQYDDDVVVPLIKTEIERREWWQAYVLSLKQEMSDQQKQFLNDMTDAIIKAVLSLPTDADQEELRALFFAKLHEQDVRYFDVPSLIPSGGRLVFKRMTAAQKEFLYKKTDATPT